MSDNPTIRDIDGPPGSGADAAVYVPGSCNIGPAEIAARQRAGHMGVVASAALLGGLLAVRAPAPARMLLAVPAGGAASGYLQARLHFCAGFGSRGLYNFGPLGGERRVTDASARAADRATSVRIGLASLAVGLAVGTAAALLPFRRPRRRPA